MDKTLIRPFEQRDLKIYGYTLPEVPSHDGYIKIGETGRDVRQRILEQVGTAGLTPDIRFQRRAQKANGEWFHDKDLHRYLIARGKRRANFGTRADEWFYFNGEIDQAEVYTDDFIATGAATQQQISQDERLDYTLRQEQAIAVEQTFAYWQTHTADREFLWNAKPRFGKTLTTYDFMLKIGARTTLIVTNRPAIANSWYDDFRKFIGWKQEKRQYYFVSGMEELIRAGALTYEQYIEVIPQIGEADIGLVVFLSLQDLKGAKFAGGPYEKLGWVADFKWDLLVIDEAHEGVDTAKTDQAFDRIVRDFTLHLSGTPFKALANEKFQADQIYNWSYLDEQKAKQDWDPTLDTNPYAPLPALSLFTYQMGNLITDRMQSAAHTEEGNIDFTFDLNEFFRTDEQGSFAHEEAVKCFLDRLTSGRMPFSPTEYLHELNHTFWLLPRVAACKAMEKLLHRHPVFKDYQTVLAAGDGESLAGPLIEGEVLPSEVEQAKRTSSSYAKVKEAIKNCEKTITLSVSQLTTGVTVPEWTAVLMLSNIQSPALYFQAAFRAQNPYEYEKNGKLFRKENAYVFDFAPERTLLLFDEFANNLTPVSRLNNGSRQDNIRELLNFFPVIAADEAGYMEELDAAAVLTIPRRLKAQEVVRQGFMSNLLFQNIAGIFAAPAFIKEILDKVKPEENKKQAKEKRPTRIADLELDRQGQVVVDQGIVINKKKDFFGDKLYEAVELSATATERKIVSQLMEQTRLGLEKMGQAEGWKGRELQQREKWFRDKAAAVVAEAVDSYQADLTAVHEDYRQALADVHETRTEEEIRAARNEGEERARLIRDEVILARVEALPEELIKREEVRKEEKKKRDSEADVRDHLRGFTRSIPAFLMAYGSPETRLATFEQGIDPATFEETTGISLEEFELLRDGCNFEDEEGNLQVFKGFFDELIFDRSIEEFFRKKEELADYFDENLMEDIFDYIPEQKTNQIYTPRAVVRLMADALEEENPGIFSDPNRTFVDLYTKSGLYLTELVKRLNEGLKKKIPNRFDRIRHILEKQVYGLAPSNIIYNIARNYVYGIHDSVDISNLVEWDMARSAKEESMIEDLPQAFGGKEMKFDVVIGNPPYQEEMKGTSDRPIYPEFMEGAYSLADKVILITPGRFLFNAGKTSKQWNQKMLHDEHLKVIFYEQKSGKVFPNTDIKGGVTVTYRDANQKFGAIEVFSAHQELNNILHKVLELGEESFSSLVYSPESYKLTNQLHKDFPEVEGRLSKGHKYDVTTNIFEKLPEFFLDEVEDENGYVRIYGRENNLRLSKYIKEEYISGPENFKHYKIFVPKSNGSGAIGERLSTPLLGPPLLGHTQTFLSIGNFENENEAVACLKYVKTCFCRVMLGVLKVTQDNKKSTWKYVPLQDFTSNSDIDWSKSVAEIDRQLYAKYKLSADEIDFIETNVQPME